MTSLPTHRSSNIPNNDSRKGRKVWLVPVYVVFAPWYVDSGLIATLLLENHNACAIKWADNKLEEYTLVQNTCGLLAGIVSAALSWQDLGSLHWAAQGLWYGTILISIVTICLATHQARVLKSLYFNDDPGQRIRKMLGAAGDPTRARKSQLFAWQAPALLLNFGVFFFVVGLVISVVSNSGKASWTHESICAFVVLAVIGICTGVIYFFSSLVLNYETLPGDFRK